MLALTAAQRRDLRARAQGLDPVVSVGRQGLTAPVLHEIDVNLLAHELIKVRVFSADRDERESVLARICAELEAAPVQHIGKLLVVWRPAPAPAAPDAAAGERPRGGPPGHATAPSQRRQRSRYSSPAGGPALSTAKSTPRARRPREPAARTPARPPVAPTARTQGRPQPASGRRRRGSQRP